VASAFPGIDKPVASMYIRGLQAVINMAQHSAYAKVRYLEADVPTHRKTGTFANAAGAY
jgi:hypothetical protein